MQLYKIPTCAKKTRKLYRLCFSKKKGGSVLIIYDLLYLINNF